MKSSSRSPIDGDYPDLARLVRHILEASGSGDAAYSARRAGRLSGVSAATINSMVRGVRPSAANLRKFADAFAVSSLPLMAAAGYVDAPLASPSVEAVANPDEANILARYRHLPPEKQRMARRLLDALGDVADTEGEGDPPPEGSRSE